MVKDLKEENVKLLEKIEILQSINEDLRNAFPFRENQKLKGEIKKLTGLACEKYSEFMMENEKLREGLESESARATQYGGWLEKADDKNDELKEEIKKLTESLEFSKRANRDVSKDWDELAKENKKLKKGNHKMKVLIASMNPPTSSSDEESE